ncbi:MULTISPECIES: hypothetical protein [Blautia]|jgi:hypothetical protein|uniref:Uncharacterized protein n=1 Tax=Blautia intestinihominis TaxID=3133152 RepID=A0ABV1AIB8_9FIRM|nr:MULTISPECIES: hypothetical protein [Blautia]NSG40672.1 hypothetical protein [Blautia obeum]
MQARSNFAGKFGCTSTKREIIIKPEFIIIRRGISVYTKKKKIVITVAVIVLIIFSMIYFSVDAKRLGEISGYYTGVDLKKDGTETSDDDDDSDIFFYNSCYDLIINSAKIPYLDVYDSEAGNPGIGGWIIGVDDDTVTLWLNPLETDFGFAPFTGNSIIPIYKFEYELKQNKIVLSHDGKEIPFRKI